MSWVVDTCVLLDVLEDDPDFGRPSARCLKRRLKAGLVACPVSLIELAPAFGGDFEAQRDFLARCGVWEAEAFTATDVRAGYPAWHAYIAAKRRRGSTRPPKRPVADIMIGAFALRFDGLITRNGADFEPWFPQLRIVDPGEG
jgi:predicted nucleic acid-binding protein